MLFVVTPSYALCEHTRTGRDFVTDDAGYLCTRRAMDPLTGCCPRTEDSRYFCGACICAEGIVVAPPGQPETKDCCASYESCVSCCQHPAHAEAMLAGYRQRSMQSPLYTAVAFDAFRYCSIRCRTSSASVFHQNKYKTALPYCYGT